MVRYFFLFSMMVLIFAGGNSARADDSVVIDIGILDEIEPLALHKPAEDNLHLIPPSVEEEILPPAPPAASAPLASKKRLLKPVFTASGTAEEMPSAEQFPATEIPAHRPVAESVARQQPETGVAEEVPIPAVPSKADLMLDFTDGGSELSGDMQKQLNIVARQLRDLQDGRLQIRAFAASGSGASDARRISLSRALAVRSYLMERGIKPVRLDVRALGSGTDESPADRVDMVFIK